MKPADLGLPFQEFNPGQLEAIKAIVNSPKKFVLLRAPTGAGKSGISKGAAKLMKAKAVVLCPTIQLQEQYLKLGEFKAVKGKSHFTCNADPLVTADEAACSAVPHKECKTYLAGDCDYYTQVEEAQESQLAVLNYPFWLIAANRNQAFTNLDLLILDECHLAEAQLSNYARIDINRARLALVGRVLPTRPMDAEGWRKWADRLLTTLKKKLERRPFNRYDITVYGKNKLLYFDILRLRAELSDDWIIEHTKYNVSFRPVWVTNWAKEHIFDHAKKVVLMSATLDPSYIAMTLGIPDDPRHIDFFELPSTFPKERRPIIVSADGVKVSNSMSDESLHALAGEIDLIIDRHSDQKGLIHAVNWNLCQEILRRSKHSSRMMSHKDTNRASTLERFKKSTDPVILVSPSMTAGVDLPYDECRFIIFAKVPFPSMVDEQVARKMRVDHLGNPNKAGSQWYNMTTAYDIVQGCGRGMRAPDDYCVTYIVDSNVEWFFNTIGGLGPRTSVLPSWFKEAVYLGDETDHIVDYLRG